MVGSELIYANGVSAGTITGFNSATSLTVSTSQTVSAQAYTINYPGLNVTSTGNVGIGTTSPAGVLDVEGSVPQSPCSYGALYNGGTGATRVTTCQSNIPIGIYVGNRIMAAEVDAVSDRRRKQDIQEISSVAANEFLQRIRPVRFHWKETPKGVDDFGFIAQEVVKAGFGNLVTQVQNASLQKEVDSDGFESPQGIQLGLNYEGVIPLLTKALQDLKASNDNLRMELKAANNNFAQLAQRLAKLEKAQSTSTGGIKTANPVTAP